MTSSCDLLPTLTGPTHLPHIARWVKPGPSLM
jgi:hypothetical protein